MPTRQVAARLDKKREKSEVKARIGAGRRRLAGLCEDESVAVFLVKIDAIDAAPEWSLLGGFMHDMVPSGRAAGGESL